MTDKETMTQKTHYADDDTLAYIAQLESELSAANARLAGIVPCGLCGCDVIGKSAPQSEQPAVGVVVPNREQLLSMAESCGIYFSRYAKGYLFASVEELERLAALLAAAKEPRK